MRDIKEFSTGDQFIIPIDDEFDGDVFTITNVRQFGKNLIVDGICDGNGDVAINISINTNEIERI